MQVDPIKTKLTLPGAKRLKLKCDEPLSNFAFSFNLRHYNKDGTFESPFRLAAAKDPAAVGGVGGGVAAATEPGALKVAAGTGTGGQWGGFGGYDSNGGAGASGGGGGGGGGGGVVGARVGAGVGAGADLQLLPAAFASMAVPLLCFLLAAVLPTLLGGNSGGGGGGSKNSGGRGRDVTSGFSTSFGFGAAEVLGLAAGAGGMTGVARLAGALRRCRFGQAPWGPALVVGWCRLTLSSPC